MLNTCIKEDIRAFVAKYISISNIDDKKDLFASGLVNSLFAMQLVMFVENNFKLKIENDDLDIKNFNSINAIADFVECKKYSLE